MILSSFSVVETAAIRFSFSLALLVLLSVLAGPVSAALIAIESQAIGPDRLFLMDETTGDVSFLTDLQDELSSFPGLSFLKDELFLANFFPGGNNPSLATVGTSNGSVSVVVPLSSRGGLASNESENVLYTIDDDDSGNRLNIITPEGSVTTVGTGTGIVGTGMAYDDMNDILYAIGADADEQNGLYTIDTTTGTSAFVGNFGEVGFDSVNWGLAYDEIDEILYGYTGDGPHGLFNIDTSTGAATRISFSQQNLYGLAWIDSTSVPEPTTILLLGLGLAGLGFARRRLH